VYSALGEEAVDQIALDRPERDLAPQALRQVRDDHPHPAVTLADLQVHRAVIENRLFDEEDAALSGAAAQEMLRPLIDEVPAQVREADHVRLLERCHAPRPAPE
jgi:hypothetical protein